MDDQDKFFLNRDNAVLVVIDVQDNFAAMGEKVWRNWRQHLNLQEAAWSWVAMVATEQY